MINLTKRHQAREFALQVLFQTEFVKDIDIKNSLDYFKGAIDSSNEVYKFAEFLVRGVSGKTSEIDKHIQSYSQNWSLSRMALVDLNILRMAVFEMLYSNNEVPPKATINEAVELAKQYSTQDSSAFINGILDQIFKNM